MAKLNRNINGSELTVTINITYKPASEPCVICNEKGVVVRRVVTVEEIVCDYIDIELEGILGKIVIHEIEKETLHNQPVCAKRKCIEAATIDFSDS